MSPFPNYWTLSITETSTNKFGEVMHDQVEERLKFYETGEPPRKNIDVMKSVLEVLGDAAGEDEPVKDKASKKVCVCVC